MSGNDTLKRFQILLFPVFDHVYQYSKKDPAVNVKDPVTHSDLLEILRNGTPEKFRVAMHKHFSPYYTSITHGTDNP